MAGSAQQAWRFTHRRPRSASPVSGRSTAVTRSAMCWNSRKRKAGSCLSSRRCRLAEAPRGEILSRAIFIVHVVSISSVERNSQEYETPVLVFTLICPIQPVQRTMHPQRHIARMFSALIALSGFECLIVDYPCLRSAALRLLQTSFFMPLEIIQALCLEPVSPAAPTSMAI